MITTECGEDTDDRTKCLELPVFLRQDLVDHHLGGDIRELNSTATSLPVCASVRGLSDIPDVGFSPGAETSPGEGSQLRARGKRCNSHSSSRFRSRPRSIPRSFLIICGRDGGSGSSAISITRLMFVVLLGFRRSSPSRRRVANDIIP